MRAHAYGNVLGSIHHPSQQSFRKKLQRDAAINEYSASLTAPVLSADYGAKVAARELSQLAWNVGRRMNKAAVTTIELVYGALDIGVPVEVVLRVPEKLASLIRARVETPTTMHSRNELMVIETEIECRINEIQVAMLTGRATLKDLIEAREHIAKYKKILEELDADIENEINQKTVGTAERESK